MSSSRKPKTINPDEVDPSVYYYDEVYDDMKNEDCKEVTKSDGLKDKPQVSKYIQGLLETADQRKTEKELRKFKRYARDREDAEAEGGLDDVDVYVTPTYKKKLEEMKRVADAKKRRLELEKDQIMNFSRPHLVDSSKKFDAATESSLTRNNETSIEVMKTETRTEVKPCDHKTNSDSSNQLAEKDEDLSDRVHKELKTIEDRKEYLRQVLVKKTVGPVFEAAVQRYKERKAKKLIF